MEIEIAYAEPHKQTLLKMSVASGTTIQQAILESGILQIAGILTPVAELAVGVFGKQRTLQWLLQEGERIEIYRTLHMDPKTARIHRAKQQQKLKSQAIQKANLQAKQNKKTNKKTND